MSEATSSKILYAFNKYFFDFIKDVKQLVKFDEATYKAIKSEYTVKDYSNTKYISHVSNIATENVIESITTAEEVGNILSLETVRNLDILSGITISKICDIIDASNNNMVTSYVLLFVTLSCIWTKELSDDESSKLLQLIGRCQSEMDIDFEEDVLDDDLCALFKKINKCNVAVKEENSEVDGVDTQEDGTDFANALENTTIGNLAKEIASSIKLDDVNISSPEDIFNGNNTQLIGDIVGKVTNNLQDKMKSGALNQDQLMSEAMSLFNNLGGANNDMFSNIMKNMGGGVPGGSHNKYSGASARQRLAKKLEKKRQIENKD